MGKLLCRMTQRKNIHLKQKTPAAALFQRQTAGVVLSVSEKITLLSAPCQNRAECRKCP